MLPYTDEENTWLSARSSHAATARRPQLTSDEVAAAVRRGHELRAEAIARLPGQISRAVRAMALRLTQRPLLVATGRPGRQTHHGQESLAHR